jgi:hypothetical protein
MIVAIFLPYDCEKNRIVLLLFGRCPHKIMVMERRDEDAAYPCHARKLSKLKSKSHDLPGPMRRRCTFYLNNFWRHKPWYKTTLLQFVR